MLEILPGPHRIEVSFQGGFLDSQPLTALPLDAKTGHTYILGTIICVSKRVEKKPGVLLLLIRVSGTAAAVRLILFIKP